MIFGRLFRKFRIRICWGSRECKPMRDLGVELTRSTQDQIGAMRTLTSFRREYHDGTGALVQEVHKLTREVARLKTAIKEKGIPESAIKKTGPAERARKGE